SDGSNPYACPRNAGTGSQGVAPGLLRPANGNYTSQERSFLGRAALFTDRPDRLDGSTQCRAPDRVRIFADPRADGAPVRAQYAPVHNSGLAVRRGHRLSRFLGSIF